MMFTIAHSSDGDLIWDLPAGYGKQKWMQKQVERGSWTDPPPVYFVIGHQMITENRIELIKNFLEYKQDHSHIRELRCNIRFAIQGFDGDQREVYEVPEIRAFFSGVVALCPYWFYFCDLRDQANLQMIAACSCEPLRVLRKKRSRKVRILVNQDSIRPFCARAFEMHQKLSELIQIPQADALDHYANALETLVAPQRGS